MGGEPCEGIDPEHSEEILEECAACDQRITLLFPLLHEGFGFLRLGGNDLSNLSHVHFSDLLRRAALGDEFGLLRFQQRVPDKFRRPVTDSPKAGLSRETEKHSDDQTIAQASIT